MAMVPAWHGDKRLFVGIEHPVNPTIADRMHGDLVAGGVRLHLGDDAAVQAACADVLRSVAERQPQARVAGVLVQKQEAAGTELLVGVRRDPVFGLVMTLGLGGVWTELFGDVVHAPLPVTDSMAPTLLRRLKGWPLLDGFRGAAPVDLTALAQAIARLSDAARALADDLDELEINPLIARADGVVAVDALLRLRSDAVGADLMNESHQVSTSQPA